MLMISRQINFTHLFNLELERGREVAGLVEYEKIEVPRSTEIGYDDGIYGHGCEELFERRCGNGRHGHLSCCSQRRLYVV